MKFYDSGTIKYEIQLHTLMISNFAKMHKNYKLSMNYY